MKGLVKLRVLKGKTIIKNGCMVKRAAKVNFSYVLSIMKNQNLYDFKSKFSSGFINE